MSYRLDVVADSVLDAVRHVGGLMFDRRRIGWQVVVVTTDTADLRALTILGARVQTPGQTDDRVHKADWGIRAVASERAAHPDAGSKGVPPAQRLLWGPGGRHGSTGALHSVRHDLSRAARTFKAAALYSAGVTDGVDGWECFWADSSLDALRFFDLVPTAVDGRLPGETRGVGSRTPTVVRG